MNSASQTNTPEMPLAATVSKNIFSLALITVALEVSVEFNSVDTMAGVAKKVDPFSDIIFSSKTL